MKNYSYFRSLLIFISFNFLLSHCSLKNDVTPVNAADVVGKWQLKTSKIVLKVNDNGKIETADQSRNGRSDEVLDIKSNGTISDPSDLFGTGTYGWLYSIKGNELALGEPGDIAYFTLSIKGNSMTWHMNLEQTNRCLNDTDGFSSILNVDVEEARGKILENDFTLEFVKK
jgi:hypothetical protein